MADSKKYNGSTWEHSLRKLGTSTDTLTTLPADVYADENSATVGISGNMEQTGTPTPQNPIQPQECGDLETEGAKAGQYKIPISSASTTTPVYLGEVETTRKIFHRVFTGQESWTKSSAKSGTFYTSVLDYLYQKENITVCSHYPSQSNVNGAAEINNKTATFYANQGSVDYLFYIRDTDFSTLEEFTTYLQQQYAAGTPVTVWCVLSTPTTGIVNEPIRKIGDYADEVSGITIPTTAGADSFDVLTTLKPSEVSLAYTGWHDATVKEWDGSEWQ